MLGCPAIGTAEHAILSRHILLSVVPHDLALFPVCVCFTRPFVYFLQGRELEKIPSKERNLIFVLVSLKCVSLLDDLCILHDWQSPFWSRFWKLSGCDVTILSDLSSHYTSVHGSVVVYSLLLKRKSENSQALIWVNQFLYIFYLSTNCFSVYAKWILYSSLLKRNNLQRKFINDRKTPNTYW